MGLATAVMLFPATKASAQISVGVSIQASFAPPEIPVYVQPECPVDGYLWQPGYWAWDPKETGALLIWITYAIYLHTRRTAGLSGPFSTGRLGSLARGFDPKHLFENVNDFT